MATDDDDDDDADDDDDGDDDDNDNDGDGDDDDDDDDRCSANGRIICPPDDDRRSLQDTGRPTQKSLVMLTEGMLRTIVWP